MCFLLSDRFINRKIEHSVWECFWTVAMWHFSSLNRRRSSFRVHWWSMLYTDNVKRVLMHGLSWYHQVKHDYFSFWEDRNGLNLQSKIFSVISIYCPAPLWLIKLCELEKYVRISEKCSVWERSLHFGKRNQTHRSPQNEVVASRLLSRGGAHFAHIPWHAG